MPVTADAAAAGAKTSTGFPATQLEATKAFGNASNFGQSLSSSRSSLPGGNGSDAAEQPPLALLEEGAGAPLLPSNSKLLQAIVRGKSPLVGLTVREAALNKRFGAEVISISRHGSSQGQPGFLQDLVLRGGDVLVLAVDASFDAAAHKDLKKELSDVEAVAVDREREFVTGLRITKRGGLAGRTLATAGLLGVNGVRLLAIDRAVGGGTLRFGADGETSVPSVGPGAAKEEPTSAASVVLDAGDVAW